MPNLGQFIGIPHLFGGNTVDGCDCIGLASHFYVEHGWSAPFDDGKPVGTPEEYQRTPSRVLRWLLRTFQRVTDGYEYGDIIVFKVCGELHIGVYIGGHYRQLLAMEVPCLAGVSSSCLYKGQFWEAHAIAGFRRRR